MKYQLLAGLQKVPPRSAAAGKSNRSSFMKVAPAVASMPPVGKFGARSHEVVLGEREILRAKVSARK